MTDLEGPTSKNGQVEDEDDPKIPWHFWIGVGLVCLYLGFRLIQGLILGFNAIF